MSSKRIPLRGYTKKEGNQWVAVCIDVNVVAQGKTLDQATAACFDLVTEYVSYVCSKYPDEVEKYIPRLAPRELIEEYDSILGSSFSTKPRKGSVGHLNNIVLDASNLRQCDA